tara:strand:+ start:118 stop:540 length:423 start_codon:yes stop_codon:yes gene_type:complete
MSFNHTKAGPNLIPAYQLSGIPYVTGSTGAAETITTKQFDFPYVTRFVTISNMNGTVDNELRLAFSAEGLTGTPVTGQKNYFSVPGSSVVNLEVRCKSVFITTSAAMEWSLCAGMTPIAASEFPALTGSNGFSGVGGAAV